MIDRGDHIPMRVLSALLDGELELRALRDARLHLAGCIECREELGRLEEEDALLALAGEECGPRPGLLADLTVVIRAERAEIEARRRAPAAPGGGRFRRGAGWPLALAAALVATIVGGLVASGAISRDVTPSRGPAPVASHLPGRSAPAPAPTPIEARPARPGDAVAGDAADPIPGVEVAGAVSARLLESASEAPETRQPLRAPGAPDRAGTEASEVVAAPEETPAPGAPARTGKRQVLLARELVNLAATPGEALVGVDDPPARLSLNPDGYAHVHWRERIETARARWAATTVLAGVPSVVEGAGPPRPERHPRFQVAFDPGTGRPGDGAPDLAVVEAKSDRPAVRTADGAEGLLAAAFGAEPAPDTAVVADGPSLMGSKQEPWRKALAELADSSVQFALVLPVD